MQRADAYLRHRRESMINTIFSNARLEIACGRACKRDCNNFPCVYSIDKKPMNPFFDRARLSGARPGQDSNLGTSIVGCSPLNCFSSGNLLCCKGHESQSVALTNLGRSGTSLMVILHKGLKR